MPGFEWFDAIDARNAAITALLNDEEVVKAARPRARNGRLPDIPILCGTHESGYFVSLAVGDVSLTARYRARPDAGPFRGVAHVDDILQPFEVECIECGARLRRSSAWIVTEAVRALSMQRAVIRARRT